MDSWQTQFEALPGTEEYPEINELHNLAKCFENQSRLIWIATEKLSLWACPTSQINCSFSRQILDSLGYRETFLLVLKLKNAPTIHHNLLGNTAHILRISNVNTQICQHHLFCWICKYLRSNICLFIQILINFK